MNQEQLEFKIGEDEEPASVELTQSDDGLEGKVIDQEGPPAVEAAQEQQAAAPSTESELEGYSDKVKKRIDKMTARLREAQRREQAALDYAKQVQAQAQQLQQRFVQTDNERLGEAKSRIETQTVALKQIIKKAREEGDTDTEVEAQERLTHLLMEQRRVTEAEQHRHAQALAAQHQAQMAAQQSQQQVTQQPQQPMLDPRAEQWAEENEWFGRDVAMTHAARGIHAQLVGVEKFDPASEAYYDELDRRIRESFPHRFQGGNAVQQTTTRANRPVQTVAPATRSSGVNNVARRTVKLSPSQVAIAKKLGVPLEEYAKYVKE